MLSRGFCFSFPSSSSVRGNRRAPRGHGRVPRQAGAMAVSLSSASISACASASGLSSPSHLATTAVAMELPTTLVALRPMSRNWSMPMMSSRPASGMLKVARVAAITTREARGTPAMPLLVTVSEIDIGEFETRAIAATAVYGRRLFDHLISTTEQRGRHRETDCFRGSEIDDQLRFGELLDWQICRLLPLENSASVDANLLNRFRK